MTYLFDQLDQIFVRTNKPFNKCIYNFILSNFPVVVIPPKKFPRR